jgi:phage repressor protein C with HTH and peptisase S24 domain
MSLGQIIRKKREELGFTLDEVAANTGFSKPYLSTIETNKVNNPPSDILLQKLETILKFDKGLLLHIAHIQRMPPDIRRSLEATNAENQKFRQIIKNIIERKTDTSALSDIIPKENTDPDTDWQKITPGRLVPIINKVAAGYPADFDDLGYPVGFADDYVRCPDLHDPSAFAVRVVGDSMEPKFSPDADVSNGNDCFVRFTMPHECTFKRIFFEPDNMVRLQPRNEKHPPMIISGERINGIYRAVTKYEKL